MIARASPRSRRRPRILSRVAVPTKACNSSIVSKVAGLFVNLGYERLMVFHVKADRKMIVRAVSLFQIGFQNGFRTVSRKSEETVGDPPWRDRPERDFIPDSATQLLVGLVIRFKQTIGDKQHGDCRRAALVFGKTFASVGHDALRDGTPALGFAFEK